MSIFNKVKTFLNSSGEYEDYEDEELEDDEDKNVQKSVDDSNIQDNNKSINENITFGYTKPKEAVTKMTQNSGGINSKLSVVLFKPKAFDEVAEIADQLNKKNTVVLNLESANKETSQRIIDFLSGVAYANDGRFNKVSNATYIITPYNVDMHGEEIGDFDASSIF